MLCRFDWGCFLIVGLGFGLVAGFGRFGRFGGVGIGFGFDIGMIVDFDIEMRRVGRNLIASLLMMRMMRM